MSEKILTLSRRMTDVSLLDLQFVYELVIMLIDVLV